jgi:hypothetical protein
VSSWSAPCAKRGDAAAGDGPDQSVRILELKSYIVPPLRKIISIHSFILSRMSQSDTASRIFSGGASPERSPTPACPPTAGFLLNGSYISQYDVRLLDKAASQAQNQSQRSPEALANLSFGIAMVVLASVGLLVQSRRCRRFAMKCLHIRDIEGPSAFGPKDGYWSTADDYKQLKRASQLFRRHLSLLTYSRICLLRRLEENTRKEW